MTNDIDYPKYFAYAGVGAGYETSPTFHGEPFYLLFIKLIISYKYRHLQSIFWWQWADTMAAFMYCYGGGILTYSRRVITLKWPGSKVGGVNDLRMLDTCPSDLTLKSSRGPPTPSRMWLESIEKEEGRTGKLAPTISAAKRISPSVKSKGPRIPESGG